MATTTQTFTQDEHGICLGATCSLLDIKRFMRAVAAESRRAVPMTAAGEEEADATARDTLATLGCLPASDHWVPSGRELLVIFDLLGKIAARSQTQIEDLAVVMLPMLTQAPDILLAEVSFDTQHGTFAWTGAAAVTRTERSIRLELADDPRFNAAGAWIGSQNWSGTPVAVGGI